MVGGLANLSAMSAPGGFAQPPLRLTPHQHQLILGHCYDGLPVEACGLFAGARGPGGEPDGRVVEVYLTGNADGSARTYTIDSRDHIKALRHAEGRGLELVGVFHSHTHSEAYPSETDVRQAVDPSWLYAIVSLRDEEPVLRAYRIRDGRIREVAVELVGEVRGTAGAVRES